MLVDVLDAVALAVALEIAERDAVDVAVEDPVAVRVFVVVGEAVAAVKAVLVGTEDAEAVSDGESDVLGLMRYARKCTPKSRGEIELLVKEMRIAVISCEGATQVFFESASVPE